MLRTPSLKKGCEYIPYRLKVNKAVGANVGERYGEENNDEIEETERSNVDDADLLEESDPDMGIESGMCWTRDSS